MTVPRIALIHATPLAIDPIRAAFDRLWPEPELINLLDDSLSRDRASNSARSATTDGRIRDLSQYAIGCGADAVLFTCSAFGRAIDAAAAEASVPVLKPNEAMFEAAAGTGPRLALLASFEPSIPSMIAEFERAFPAHSGGMTGYLADGAMQALAAGHSEQHDRILAETAKSIAGCDAILLAQFSTARAASSVESVARCPVLTSPSSAVAKLRREIEGS